ncbi:hypothetical protein [Pseudoalteromonas gelatinilytica]|nr:hypothetical protein [Pseudoalteromonas profundi]
MTYGLVNLRYAQQPYRMNKHMDNSWTDKPTTSYPHALITLTA